MLLCPDTLPLYQASRALCCRGGSGGRECTRHHPPGPKLLAPHPVKEAPCGEVAVHERVPLLVEETDAGMYGPAGSEKTFVLKVMGALPLGHVLVEASTTRGHGEFLRDADAATVACQKSGIYPTFDSAARLG